METATPNEREASADICIDAADAPSACALAHPPSTAEGTTPPQRESAQSAREQLKARLLNKLMTSPSPTVSDGVLEGGGGGGNGARVGGGGRGDADMGEREQETRGQGQCEHGKQPGANVCEPEAICEHGRMRYLCTGRRARLRITYHTNTGTRNKHTRTPTRALAPSFADIY